MNKSKVPEKYRNISIVVACVAMFSLTAACSVCLSSITDISLKYIGVILAAGIVTAFAAVVHHIEDL